LLGHGELVVGEKTAVDAFVVNLREADYRRAERTSLTRRTFLHTSNSAPIRELDYSGRSGSVKVGRLGEFIISARAVAQGTRFAGVFRITRPQPDWTVTLPFQEQDELDATFETREEAIEAAYAFAESLVKSRDKSSRG